jgi:polyhydroxyalkanoate synthesis regulator phasin
MRRYLLALIAVGALSAGVFAVAAVAAQEGTPTPEATEEEEKEGPRERFLDRLAENLGISREELDSTIDETQIEMIDEAVAEGRITEERGEELKQRVEDGLPLFPGPRHHGPFHRVLGWLKEASAEILGLSEDDVAERVRDGESLAEIAESQGMSVDDFKAQLLEAAKADLDEKVADGDMTQDEADEKFERLSEEIDRIVNASPPEGGPPPHGPGGPGPGFRWHGGAPPMEGIPDSPF